MIKTVVLGGGFISGHLVRKLRKLKHKVTLIHHDEKPVIKEADYIFYISSYGNHYHQKDPVLTIKANVTDYLSLLRSTLDVQYRGLFYFSTSSVTLPVQTTYSDSKYIGELLGKRFFKKYHKPIVSIRPSSVYGEGEADFRFFPTLIRNFKKKQKMPLTEGCHDWIYINDFVDGVVAVMNHAHELSGKSVPVGTGIQTKNSQIFKMMINIAGYAVPTEETQSVKRHYDTKNWVADNTILKSFGWEPKYKLEEGLTKLWENYKDA